MAPFSFKNVKLYRYRLPNLGRVLVWMTSEFTERRLEAVQYLRSPEDTVLVEHKQNTGFFNRFSMLEARKA